MAAPLSNIRVLDISRILAGPWAGRLLGDYGADVVKIERPGIGDDTRQCELRAINPRLVYCSTSPAD